MATEDLPPAAIMGSVDFTGGDHADRCPFTWPWGMQRLRCSKRADEPHGDDHNWASDEHQYWQVSALLDRHLPGPPAP